MTTIVQIRDDLAAVIDNISGWRTKAFLSEGVDAPVIKISRPAFDPRMVFQQAKQVATFRAKAYVSRGTGESGERQLEALAELSGSGSLAATVQTGSNWSVTVDYAQVTRIGEIELDLDTNAGAGYMTLTFDIEVVW